MGWRNVGIKKKFELIQAISGPSRVTDIRQVTELTVAEDGQSLVLPAFAGKLAYEKQARGD